MSEQRITLTWATADQVPAGDDWLGPQEQAQQARLRIAPRRQSWRLGRWTAKQAIRQRVPDAAPSQLEIIAAEDGAPEPFLDGAALPLSLSLSHRDDLGLCALAPQSIALGCDLETVEDRGAAFIADYFLAEEQAWIAADAPLRTNLLWSAKESALKALRTGLRRDTRSVRVFDVDEPAAGWARLRVEDLESGRHFAGRWQRREESVVTVVAAPWPGLAGKR